MESERTKLLDFVSQHIDHVHNPESFRYQLEMEINHHLKQEQQQLKQQRIRARNQQLQQQEIKRREELQARIQQKTQKGSQMKIKRLEERVKSMSQLRQRREEYTAAKLKESRKQELKKSLEKIKQFDEQREKLFKSKLIRTESQSKLSRSLHLSHLQRRNQSNEAKYDALVLKLQSKGIFKQPLRKGISKLYAQKAKFIREQANTLEDQAQNLLGAKLQKIQGARQRKESMLRQKAQKMKKDEQYQRQLKKGKLAQLQAQEREKRKKLQVRQAMKVMHLRSLQPSKLSVTEGLRMNDFETQGVIDRPKIKQRTSLREEIRRQIERFKHQSD